MAKPLLRIHSTLKLPPIISALILQALSLACIVTISHILNLKLPVMVLAVLCGILASTLSYFAKLASWWLIIQVIFLPTLVITLSFNVDSRLFLIGFIALLLIYWNTFNTQVPLYLSSNKVWQSLAVLIPTASPDQHLKLIDIGSGLGGVLTYLAKNRPDGYYYGVESAPLPFLWSWLRIKFGGYHQCKVRWGSFWDSDLSQYDVVFAYLSPAPMERLWQKATREMKTNSLFISSTFSVPNQTPFEIIEVNDLHQSRLLVWKM